MARDDRRGSERYTPPRPVPATFGGFDAKIIDISLIGCRIEHSDRLPPKARLSLRFSWRGSQVKVDATVVRSELTSIGKKPAYVTGLAFCDAPEYSPPVIRDIIQWLMASTRPAQIEVEEAPEEVSAPYLRCTFTSGQWLKVFVDDPAQPKDGFTIRAPANEREADVLCRAWEHADAAKRQSMRASFEKDIQRR
jgi:hypothetical protein